MSKINTKLIISIAPLLILFIGCEETPPQAGISYRIEGASLTIEPSLSKKSTATTPDVEGNIVFENDVLLVRTSGNFALVSGLVNDDIVLTNGQAFVSPGEKIEYKINWE